jgi:transcriptional regulator with XRE-family HTH domain
MRVTAFEDVGIIARQRRQDLAMSQVELAARAGVTRQWLTRFERGNSEVSLSKVLAILRELDLKVRIDAIDRTGSAAGAPTRISFEIPRIEMPRITLPEVKSSFTVSNLLPINNPELLSQVRDRINALVKSRGLDRPKIDD